MVAAPTTPIPKDANGVTHSVLLGTDGTNWNPQYVDTAGNARNILENCLKASYVAATAAFSSAASATDIWDMIGSATKTVKIQRIEISGVQTTAGIITALLIKRAAANTGGTSVAATSVPLDSTNAAATAASKAYTANPTINSTVGNLLARKILVPAPASLAPLPAEILFDALQFGQPIVLRGIAEAIAINLGGVTVTGGSFHVTVYWTEE